MIGKTSFARYVRGDLRADAVAGLTVAIVGVPSAMAYAIIADLPPVYGLYTAIATCAVSALLGSSRHLIVGPTNALCMVLLSVTAPLVAHRGADAFEVILLLTFLAGVIQLAFGLLRLGGLVRYVSNGVIVGFTAGAGILIAVNQLHNVIGVALSPAETGRFHEVLIATVRHIPDANPHACGIALLTALIVIGMPRIDRRLPAALIGVAVAATLTWALGWHDPAAGAGRVEVIGDIQPIRGNLLEMFRVPALLSVSREGLALARELSPAALALALMGLIEAASIARATAARSGQRVDFSRQFVGQGAGNIVGSFFSCFAASGSPSRTTVNFQAGARTRMGAVFSSGWTALTVVLLAPVANFIPLSALAGLLIVIAYSMVDKHKLRLVWRTRASSRVVLFGTLGATLVLPLEYAVFVGVLLSVLNLLRMTGKVDLTHLVPRSDGGFDEVPFNRAPPSDVVTINMAGDLYFAAVDDLDNELLRSLTPRTRVVVLRMKRLRAVGSTAMAILEHFWTLLHKRHIRLVVCGIEGELQKVMTQSGLRRQIGELNIFYADNKLFQSTELALARARSIVRTERSGGDTSRQGDRPAHAGITAADIMSQEVIRFGNGHQLREAVWLLSEMQKRLGAATPSALFLQDKDGKLWGQLSMSRLLREMKRGVDVYELHEADDDKLRLLLRKNFTDSIASLARTDLHPSTPETHLGELIFNAVRENTSAHPVCQSDGRVVGRVEPKDLVTGLAKSLGVQGEAP